MEYKTLWVEQQPATIHRYRVVCHRCGKFIAWGNEDNMNTHVGYHNAKVITLAEQEANPKPTLDGFFSD